MSKKMNKASKWLKKHVSTGIGQRFPIYTATIVVWFVTGMWHGASWNFIVWGLLNGIIMLASQELTEEETDVMRAQFIRENLPSIE